MNGMKIELKAIWGKKLKVYHYVLKLDEFHMVKRLLAIFCSLEKRHYIGKNMAKLTDKDDNVLTDSNDIILLQEENSFYEKL